MVAVDTVAGAVVVVPVESAIAGKRLALIQTPKDLRPRPLLYKGITRRGPEVLQKMGLRCAPETTLKGSHSDWGHHLTAISQL